MINKDKKAVFIVAFNHHKQETSIKEMLEKKINLIKKKLSVLSKVFL